jgi:hypothetical protein
MGRTGVLIAVATALAAGGAGAQDSPLDALRRLVQPPVDAITEAFRPRPPVATPGDGDPVAVPLPRLRPASAVAAPPVLGYQPAEAPATGAVPPPRMRPERTPGVAALPADPLPTLTPPPPAARSTCGVALALIGVRATPLAAIDEDSCKVTAPVAVASLADGAVDFTTRAILECRLAETLATWIDETVQPRAEAILGGRVTGLRIAASYACRNRNNLDDARLSEHARGNAIDISGFRVGDRWIEVESGWSAGGAEAEFLRALRTSACGPFKTVLGPGADAYHADHFHLDMAKRRSGRAYCR